MPVSVRAIESIGGTGKMKGMIDISLLLPRGRAGVRLVRPCQDPGPPASFLPVLLLGCVVAAACAPLLLASSRPVIPPGVRTRDLAAVVPVPALPAGGASAPRALSHAWREGRRLHDKPKRRTQRATTAEASAVYNRAATNRAYAKISARPDEAGEARRIGAFK